MDVDKAVVSDATLRLQALAAVGPGGDLAARIKRAEALYQWMTTGAVPDKELPEIGDR